MLNLIQYKPRGLFSGFTLKWIAIISMVTDHIGVVLFPDIAHWFRCFGRISFPIFCFLIIEGFYHTHNLKKYTLRLAAFAIISEIPYDLAFFGEAFTKESLKRQNVFFTLLIGLVMIALTDLAFKNFEKIAGEREHGRLGSLLLKVLPIVFCFFFLLGGLGASVLLEVDYPRIGVLTIMALYIFRRYEIFSMLSIALINLHWGTGVQPYASFSIIPIMLYNGEKGRSMKWLFYVFYPAHLLILFLIRYMFLSPDI